MSSNLNAGKLLKEHMELNESFKSLSSSEKKLYESIFKNPGMSRSDISVKTNFTNSEVNKNLFSLAKKSLIHIVDNDNIYPMF